MNNFERGRPGDGLGGDPGGLFAYLNVGFMLMVTHGDMTVTLDGAQMLSLPEQFRQYFRLSMFADLLGFYLPLLVIGGYLWRAFREQAGALGDMAVLAIATYVVLGVVGAGPQLSVLNPLAEIHQGGTPAVQAAAEVAWTSIAVGSQRGLWWCEGRSCCSGVVVGSQLKNAVGALRSCCL
jgi:hypothetical protein